ncbi:MAG: RNB domain-containing ribonuclease, partial [Myxococcales bacterium]
MTDFPSPPAAVPSARDAVQAILNEEGLPPQFPPEVEAEVEALQRSPGLDDPTLVDLRALPFVTIDGPTSRDLDQALFIERDGDELVAHYAIADASYFVRPGSALFAEALRRGASYYVPGRVVPMLPPALSEGLISLNPDGPRRAVVFTSRLDPSGQCLGTTVRRALIQSQAKLAFGQVQEFLDRDAAGHDDPLAHRPFTGSLRLLAVVGQRRMRDQQLRQVVRYRRVEIDVRLSDGDDALMAVVASRGAVELYNEQLSLLCNSEGGLLLCRDDGGPVAQGIYRAHPSPPASRLAELEALVAELVTLHGLDDTWRWRRDDARGLSEFLMSLPTDGPHERVATAIQRQAIMTNLGASYTDAPASHHGVGARPYARFSAPMREVVGVFVHKELVEKLGLQPRQPDAQDESLRQQVIASATRARDLQGQLDGRINRLVIDRLLRPDLSLPPAARPRRLATVMGLTANKVHVQLDDPMLDMKLY